MKYTAEEIAAMQTLRNHYNSFLKNGYVKKINCPFCLIYGTLGGQLRCNRCPWVIETDKVCLDNETDFATSQLRNCDPVIPNQILVKWCKKRINELDKWINK